MLLYLTALRPSLLIKTVGLGEFSPVSNGRNTRHNYLFHYQGTLYHMTETVNSEGRQTWLEVNTRFMDPGHRIEDKESRKALKAFDRAEPERKIPTNLPPRF